MRTKMQTLFTALAVFALIFVSCEKDEQPVPETKSEVSFSFKKASLKQASALKSTAAIEDAAAVIVSITDNAGNLVYDLEQVELINMNGSFISKPLSLLIGDYSLTQFVVVDNLGEAIYIAPLANSPKAYLVNEPLPIDFSIIKDQVTKLTPEVLSTEESQPEDFGYSTFSFEVVETFDFLIGVFAYNETSENFEMTNAQLTVEADGSIIYSGAVEAITDTVTLNDGYTEYILRVEKDGYTTFVDTIANADLKLHFSSEDNGPLIVILETLEIAIGQPCPGTPTVTDADGNVYPTVQIGDQCWMAENLNIGTQINLNSGDLQQDNNIIEKYCYNDSSDNCEKYGAFIPGTKQ